MMGKNQKINGCEKLETDCRLERVDKIMSYNFP